MNQHSTIVQLGDLMAERGGSTDPSKHIDTSFALYSIPAFDAGAPEFVLGAAIGSSKKDVEPGDVLVSRIVPHIRRAWIVEKHVEPIIASGEWIIFRDRRIYPNYLRHFLISDVFHKQFMMTVAGVGGSLLRARPAGVARIEIHLPPLDEQRRIAAILDKADALRQKRKRAIALLDSLTQSIFKTVTADLGAVMRPLSDALVFVTSGGRNWTKYTAEEGARFIRSFDVQNGWISGDDPIFVDAPDNAEAKRTRTQAGDVLLTITGSRIGRASSIPDDLSGAYVSQHVAILRLDRGTMLPTFLSDFLISEQGQAQIAKWQYGQTKPGLNFDQIRRFEIPVVPLASQSKYLEHRKALEARMRAVYKSAAAGDTLFASLQHRAFSGQL